MKDIIVKKLHDRLSKKIGEQVPGNQKQAGQVSKFDQVLMNKSNQSSSTQMMEKMVDAMNGQDKKPMQAISADDIQITLKEGEFEKTSNFHAPKAVHDLFATINDSSLKLDAMVDALSQDGVKFSRQEMIAIQASTAAAGQVLELSSKLAQSLNQSLTTILQTNMG